MPIFPFMKPTYNMVVSLNSLQGLEGEHGKEHTKPLCCQQRCKRMPRFWEEGHVLQMPSFRKICSQRYLNLLILWKHYLLQELLELVSRAGLIWHETHPRGNATFDGFDQLVLKSRTNSLCQCQLQSMRTKDFMMQHWQHCMPQNEYFTINHAKVRVQSTKTRTCQHWAVHS